MNPSPGTVRFVLIVAGMAGSCLLAWEHLIPGSAAFGIISLVVGGAVHGAGARQGAEAAKDPS